MLNYDTLSDAQVLSLAKLDVLIARKVSEPVSEQLVKRGLGDDLDRAEGEGRR